MLQTHQELKVSGGYGRISPLCREHSRRGEGKNSFAFVPNHAKVSRTGASFAKLECKKNNQKYDNLNS
jgi:hypothetical protein